MCGRIVLSSAPHVLAEKFFLDMVPDLLPRYNIAPTTNIAGVVPNSQLRRHVWSACSAGAWCRRGAKVREVGPKMINARSETVRDKAVVPRGLRQPALPDSGRTASTNGRSGQRCNQPFLFRRRDR